MSFRQRFLFCIIVFFLPLMLLGQAPTEKYLVSDFSTAQVHVLNVSDNQEVGVVRAGGSPAWIAVAPGGRIAYVSNINSNYISVLDFTLNPPAEVARIQNAHVRPMTLSADGTRLYGLSFSDDVVVVDTSSLQIIQRFPLNIEADASDVDPRGLALAGNHLFVQARSQSQNPMPVFVVDLSSGSVTPVAGTETLTTRGGATLAATPDGKFVVSARVNPNSVFVIDAQSGSVVATATPSTPPSAIAIPPASSSPDGVIGYVIANRGGQAPTVQALDLRQAVSGAANPGFATLSGGLSLPLAAGANFIKTGITADGTRLYIDTSSAASPNNVAVVDLNSFTVLSSAAIGTSLQGLAVAFVQTAPPASAPQVTDVNSNQTFKGVLVNSADSTITVTGSGFSPDVQVRVGNLNAMAPTSATASTLLVPIPQAAAGQSAQIIATNLNASSAVSDQLQSGILRGQFVIASPPTFQPANQVVTGNFADGTISILNVATNAPNSTSVPAELTPSVLAFSPDGVRAYIGSFTQAEIGVFNVVTNHPETAIPLSTVGPSLTTMLQVIANPATGVPGAGHPVLYVITQLDNGDGTVNEQLNIYDVEPGTPAAPNPSFNQLVGTVTAAVSDDPFFEFPLFTASSDGRYVYESTDDANDNGQVLIFDVVNRTVNAVSTTSLGAANQGIPMLVSPDGKSLLLSAPDGSIRVCDLPSPLQVGMCQSITGTAPGFASLPFDSFRIVGTQLYAYASALVTAPSVIQVFNFDRSNPAAFGQNVASYTIPGVPNGQSSQFAITPDGKLLYAELKDEDAVAVIDVGKLLAGNPDPLLTKLATGISPLAIAVRPGTPTPASTPSNPVVVVQPMQQLSVSLSDATGGSTSAVATNNTPVSVPAGFQVGAIPVFYELSTTSAFSNAVVCISYDPTHVPSPESSLRLAHYNSDVDPSTGQPFGWMDVTIPGSPDTSTHTICGQVSSFSPFVIGVASADFMFNTLLEDTSNLNATGTSVGTMRSLRAKVLAARASATRGNNNAAINQLGAFITELNSLPGGQVSASTATNLIAEAKAIQNEL